MFAHFKLHGDSTMKIVFAAALLAVPSFAQVGLGLIPMRVELPGLAPGKIQSGVLTVTNDAPGKVRVSADVLDFYIDETQTPQFGRAFAQEQDYSCRQWMTMNPMQFELEAGAQIAVRYSLRVPGQTEGRSFHCAAGFT